MTRYRLTTRERRRTGRGLAAMLALSGLLAAAGALTALRPAAAQQPAPPVTVQQPTPPPGVAPDPETVRANNTTILNPDSTQPLEITADQTLEWHRDAKQYIARGNAVAKQGDTEIHAATLTADYRESAQSSFDIYRLSAEGGVRIISPGHAVAGDKAVYDVPSGKAVMTGKALTLTAPDQTVTARDSFEYAAGEGRLTANGDVLVVRGADRIRAEIMSAFFARDAAGQNRLTKLTAERRVVITTPAETLHGDFGRYLARTNTAELYGNVRIQRGPNVLEGARAVVDLNTHVSRMEGGGTGQVRGIFYPGSERGGSPAPAPAPAPAPDPANGQAAPAAPRAQFIPGQPPGAAPPAAPAIATGTAAPPDRAVVPVPPPGAVQGPVP